MLSALKSVPTSLEITFSNRAYAAKWFKMLRRQNTDQFTILQAIIEEIEIKDGRDISKADVFRRHPKIQEKVQALGFDIIPSRGQMLRHNGNGIRHAKFSPSKSVAIVWEKISNTIFVTFDDHAPIRYHTAITHLRELKLGKAALPKRARNTGNFLRKLRAFWKRGFSRDLTRFDPKHKYYE